MTRKNLVAAIGALGLMAVGSMAQACQVSAWDLANSTATDAQAGGKDEAISPFSNECGLNVTAPDVYVQDSTPGNETSMTMRFFFLAGTGATDILRAFSDEAGASEVLSLAYDSGTGQVTLDVGGATTSAAVNVGEWNMIEINYNAETASTAGLYVNSNAPDNTTANTVATTGAAISSVRLGAMGGSVSGNGLTFDDYEARRSTEIGRLSIGGNDVYACDADASGAVDIDDAFVYINYFVNPTSSPNFPNVAGTTDCDINGVTDIDDGILAINIFVLPGVNVGEF